MTWAFKRQISYLAILVAFFSVFGFLIIQPYLNQASTCSDHEQNGDEAGVDCGGACLLVCLSQVEDVSVLWARSFRVVPGRYNAVAYLVNHNKNAIVQKINYRFRFADANNLYIGKREGSSFIPPSGNFAIFEPGIDVGYSIPVYTSFEFTQVPQWIQVPQEKLDQLKISVSNIILAEEKTNPVLSATVKNNSFFIIPEMDIVAILYDAGGNALSASRTFVENLRAEEGREVNFTWPEPLSGQVVAQEIIPSFNIFSVKLK